MVNLKVLNALGLLMILQVSISSTFAAPPSGIDAPAAHAAFEKGHYRQAAAHYQRLLQNAPGHAGHRMKLAASYELSGKLKLAEAQATNVLGRDRKNIEALLMMGRISGRQEDWSGAKTYYGQAVNADENNASAHLGLSQALIQLGEDASSESAFAEYRRLTGVPTP